MSPQPAALPIEPVNPGWGEDYGCGRAAYITREGIAVWMWRKGVRVRFYDARGAQHGPQHANVYPSILWAAANGWIDPHDVNGSIACIVEVRKQMAENAAAGTASKVERELLDEIANGAWDARASADPHRDRWKNPSPPASIQVDRGDKTPAPPSSVGVS